MEQDQGIKGVYLSYASKENNMRLSEFSKFLEDTKIYTSEEAKDLYDKFCEEKKFSFDSFKYTLQEIAFRKKTGFENIGHKILINLRKKKILERQENLRKNKNKSKGKEQITKEILEDMSSLGSILKEEIIEEKKNNPGKFISIQEAIKDEQKENNVNFCLGVLAQNLENIGITTAIIKDEKNEEDIEQKSGIILDFISNGLIDKKKYDLHFDFDSKRNKELLNDKQEQEKFHHRIKKALSLKYDIPEDEIQLINPQKGSYRVQVVFMSEQFDKEIDIKEFQNDLTKGEFKDLCYLKKIQTTLIMEGCKLSKKLLDYKGNRYDNWPTGEKRGGKKYFSPKGWKGFGLKVEGKYDNGNDDWLACNGNKNEWAVAYHGVGTKLDPEEELKLEDAVGDIAKGGFKIGERQLHKKEVGIGIYCSPKPEVLEYYAKKAQSETKINGRRFMMGFMMRVKPDKIRVCPKEKDYWVLNPSPDEMRPYRILVKEKK